MDLRDEIIDYIRTILIELMTTLSKISALMSLISNRCTVFRT
jgi:hypothetical protein